MTEKIVYQTINLFESRTITIFGVKFRTGWKVSEAKLNWERESSAFNKAIVLVAKKNKKLSKKIPWQEMASCMAESHRNQADAIMAFRGNAVARVVDMEATFGEYLE